MKLYTEEEVFKAIQMADKYHCLLTSEECDIVNSLTPIELPSDEEILKQLIIQSYKKGFLMGFIAASIISSIIVILITTITQ